MTLVRYRRDPTDPPRLAPAEAAALDDLTDEQITAAALDDADNPPLTADELARMRVAVGVRQLRRSLDLSQSAFAERYGIPLPTLRQWEIGRRSPDATSLAYLRVIAALPAEVAAALRAA